MQEYLFTTTGIRLQTIWLYLLFIVALGVWIDGWPVSLSADYPGESIFELVASLDLLLQLARLLLELVILTDDLLVRQVLHVLVNAQIHKHVQLGLAQDKQHEHEHSDQNHVHEKDAHVVRVARIQDPVGTVWLLKPIDVEDVKACVEQNLTHDKPEKKTFWSKVVLLAQHHQHYS